MRKLVVCLALACVLGFSLVSVVGADELSDLKVQLKAMQKQMQKMQQRIEKLETERQAKVKAPPKEMEGRILEGLNLGAGATFVVQATHDANRATNNKEDATDASYSVDLTIEKEFGDFGLGFIHLEAGDGGGVEDELEVFSNVNRDSGDSNNSVDLTEAWYEHYALDNHLSLTLGKIDATCYLDQNEIANDECAQFLGRIFRNAPTIDFPDNNFGVHAFYQPYTISWLEFQTQIMDGAGNWEDIFDSVFTSYQFNFKPTLDNLTANYRLYGWYKYTDYTEWANSSNQFEHKYGWGFSLDQQLSDNFTLFSRYSWCDPDVYDSGITSSSGANFSLEHTWSVGAQFEGDIWGRENDYLGVAIGQAIPSDKYEQANSNRKADNEGHFEMYYAWHLNDHLTLSPDLQIIWNPFGNDYIVSNERRDSTITVIGCRGQVDF